ncbi:MAG: 16S rRNA (uracil(1498)-N(3))-methyltransferase [Desulfobacteraceae bacterium]|nr:MAG: 16S rRNA (uracil(1498)-N(3))-methyltransferase [Desulfobacteraceae bacterium]
MRRFFIEKIDPEAECCTLTGQEARHICKVLRMKPGDPLILSDCQGRQYQGRIDSISRQHIQVKLEKPLPALTISPLDLTLCQAVLKSRAMDLLIEKISELGVTRLRPFISSRTVLRLDAAQAKAKMRHWQAVAQSATKQSERTVPLSIDPIRGFEETLKQLEAEPGLKLILWEEEESQGLQSLLKASALQTHFIGMIGPEGGFTETEVKLASAAGFISVSLGQRILRAETAGIALAALMQYEWGDLGL